jgi:hypothetical protein
MGRMLNDNTGLGLFPQTTRRRLTRPRPIRPGTNLATNGALLHLALSSLFQSITMTSTILGMLHNGARLLLMTLTTAFGTRTPLRPLRQATINSTWLRLAFLLSEQARARLAVAHTLLRDRACLIALSATACGRTTGPLRPLADGAIDRAGNFDGTVLSLDQVFARFTTVGGLAKDGPGAGGFESVAGLAGRPFRPIAHFAMDHALLHVARLRRSRTRGRARVVLATNDTSLRAITTVFGASTPITNFPIDGSGDVALLLRHQLTTSLATTRRRPLDGADALLHASTDRLRALRPCLPLTFDTIACNRKRANRGKKQAKLSE